MSRNSARRSIFILCALSTFVFNAGLAAQQPKVLAPHRPVDPTITPRPNWPVPVKTPRSMVGGLWMIDANFRSTIYLKNDVKNAAVTVTPVLYLSNGKSYVLPDVNLDPSGTATVNINDALARQGIASWATLSGYVEIKYTWAWDPLCVTIQNVDTVHSLIFTYFLRPSSPDPRAQTAGSQPQQSQTLQGMWWKQESNVAGFVALSNVLTQPVSAKIVTSDDKGTPLLQHTVTVSPHGTKIVQLNELNSSLASSGGVTVNYAGAVNDLLINGGLEDPATGYSANMRFAYPRRHPAQPPAEGYAELGLMAGAADPMMSFPAGTTFAPYSVIRNIGDLPIQITPTLWWMEAGAARSAQLPQWAVPPHATQSLPLQSLMSQTALKNFNGSFNLILASDAPPGSFLMASGSVDQSNTYVFEVIPQGLGESIAKSLSYWSTGNGDDTMVTLWNPADEAQNLVFTLFFAGGSYRYPVPLGPRATRTFNVSEIIQNQLPDENGNTIPAGVHEGSAEIAGVQAEQEHILVAMAAGTYNVRKATCAGNCTSCSGYTGIDEFDLIELLGAGQTTSATYSLLNSSGSYVNFSGSSSWRSSSASIATANTPGTVKGITPGTFTAYATTGYEPEYDKFDCPTGDNQNCPTEQFTGSGPSRVTPSPQITSISPISGQTGSVVLVTISGNNFGSNAAALSISGITGTVSSVNPAGTQIAASFNLTGLPPGSYSVVVNLSNGDGGGIPSNSWPFSVYGQGTTAEVTIIGWVNASAVTVPSGENATLQANLNNSPTSCGIEVGKWVVGSLGDVNGAADVAYANAWLVSNSGNPAPPPTIIPSSQLAGGNFRLFNDFQVGPGSVPVISTTQVGITPDPCKTGVIPGWIQAGQPHPNNGTINTSPSGEKYQLAEGRIGTVGQLGSETLNGGRTVPWIWSVVEFDSSGNPTTTNDAMFPTYSVYSNGVLTATYPQSAVATFVALDQTYQLLPSQIP
jgi:hypothetical protein